MYDTVRLHLQTQEHKHVLRCLKNVDVTTKSSGEVIYQGRIGPLRVYVNTYSVTVEGSLPKFWNGNNLEALTIKNTEMAIHSLSDALSLPMIDASVSRLDFGVNLIVEKQVAEYLLLLGGCQNSGDFRRRLHQQHYSTGITYTNKNFALVVYDKLREMESSKQMIPPDYVGKNVIRFEIQYKHRAGRQILKRMLLACDLYNSEFVDKVAINLRTAYSAIAKLTDNSDSAIESASTDRELANALAVEGLKHLGKQNVNDKLKMMWRAGRISVQSKARMQRRINLLDKNSYGVPNNCITELDAKMNIALMEYALSDHHVTENGGIDLSYLQEVR